MTDPPDWRGAPAHRRMAGLLRAIAELHDGEQTDASIAAAGAWLQDRREWRSADVYDHLLDACAPRIGVEKSPEHASGDAPLARVEAAYPRARYIHLTRHPVPAVQSMHREWHTLGYWTIEPELFHHFCLGVWYFQHARIDRFVAQRDAERVLRVRSEDLVNSPAPQLRRICTWLRVDDSDDAIDAMCHPERSPYARLGPSQALGGGDSGYLRDPVLRPTRCPTRSTSPPTGASTRGSSSGARARRTDGLWPVTHAGRGARPRRLQERLRGPTQRLRCAPSPVIVPSMSSPSVRNWRQCAPLPAGEPVSSRSPGRSRARDDV